MTPLSRQRLAAAALLALALLGPAGACSRSPRTNLLLITLDTTRADRLGCYGYRSASTPHLDRLAAEGALFEQALAVAPLTLPAHASLLTGLYPPGHGVRDNADYRLPERFTTLAEHLRGSGYRTAAVVGSYVLSSSFGLAQGFDSYDEPRVTDEGVPLGGAIRSVPIVERVASEVSEAARRALASSEQPFFLWVHYYDPHAEYTPPAPFAERFSDRPYDGEIAYVDSELGGLIDGLRADGRLDDTLVVVVGDHGEGLGEHGEATHGLFVYDSTLRVPLVLRLPRAVSAGTRISRGISGVDLLPSLLELLGLPALDVDGQSFAPLLSGKTMPEREPIYAEALLSLRAYGWAPLYALRDAGHKFIDAPEAELYAIQGDPKEEHNLATTAKPEVDAWRDRLDSLRASWPEALREAEQVLDAESRARLASLGYLSSSAPGTAAEETRKDPKNLVALHDRLVAAQSRLTLGDESAARALVQSVIAVDPSNPAALALEGLLLCSSSRIDDGLARLREAAERAGDVYEIQHNLANALHLSGRFEEAVAAYRAALGIRPDSTPDHYGLGNALFAIGDHRGAIAAYREADRPGAGSTALRAALAVALAASGEMDEARGVLEKAGGADAFLAGGWNELGVLTEKSGDLSGALALYERALAIDPTHLGARFDHAKVSLRLGRTDAAVKEAERLVADQPRHPSARFLLARARLALGDGPGARRSLEAFLAQEGADPLLIPPSRELLDQLGP